MNFRPSVDPSGRSMVWERRRPGASDQILFHDLAGGRPVQLAQAVAAATSHVLLTPDGRSAAYRLQAPGLQPILLEPVAGGPPQRICENCGMPSDWSPDGSHLWYVTGGHPAAIGLLHVKTGRHADSLKHPSYNLYGARQHVDANGDGWLAFYADNGPLSRQIYLAPIRQYQPGEPDSWIAATTGAQWDVSPAWAPDGNTLYFVSRRDGFSCIMAQRLDPATKRPVGTAWTVHHFHGPRQSLMRTSTNRGSDALWVANGRIYFTLDNATSGLRLLSGLHR